MWCNSCKTCGREQVVSIQTEPVPSNQEGPDNFDTEAAETPGMPVAGHRLPAHHDPPDPLVDQATTTSAVDVERVVRLALSKGNDQAEADVKEFQVKLQRTNSSTDGSRDDIPAANVLSSPGKTLGALLDASTGATIFVSEVYDSDCPVSAYNRTAPPELQIKVGDFIVEVNGHRGNMTIMMQEMHLNRNLTVLVTRAMEYDINVHKQDTLGCSITYDANAGISLGIACVLEGPIKVWNDENPSMRVLEGDRIIAVNGVKGVTSDLLDVIRKSEELWMTLARPASSAVE